MKNIIKQIIDHPLVAVVVTVIYTFFAGPMLIETHNPLKFWLSIGLGIVILVWWLYFTRKFIHRKINNVKK